MLSVDILYFTGVPSLGEFKSCNLRKCWYCSFRYVIFTTDVLFFGLKLIFYYTGGCPISNHVIQIFKTSTCFYQVHILNVLFWVTSIELFDSDVLRLGLRLYHKKNFFTVAFLWILWCFSEMLLYRAPMNGSFQSETLLSLLARGSCNFYYSTKREISFKIAHVNFYRSCKRIISRGDTGH